jgi:hypothetical protein
MEKKNESEILIDLMVFCSLLPLLDITRTQHTRGPAIAAVSSQIATENSSKSQRWLSVSDRKPDMEYGFSLFLRSKTAEE